MKQTNIVDGGHVNDSLKLYIEQIRKRFWVVLMFVVLAVAISATSWLHTSTSYTGKSVLVLSSSGRSPDQDAVMADGYAQVFNDPATIGRLEASKRIPPGVRFEARTAASSPILIIEATADNPDVAQQAALDMGQAFRTDVNSVRATSTAEGAAELSQQLNALRSQPTSDGAPNPEAAVLQERINAMKFDSTNQLQDLQPRAGVSASSPSIGRNIALGAAGGTILGIMVALALGAVSTRLTSSSDIQTKTGVEPLVELPDGRSGKSAVIRQERLRTLANLVGFEQLPKSMVVAVTHAGGVQSSWGVAAELGRLWGEQGYRTALVDAAGGASCFKDAAGFAEALDDSHAVSDMLQASVVETLKILPAGQAGAQGLVRATRERVDAVLDELRMDADITVVAAPPVATIAEAQLICAAADLTLLVVTRNSTRVEEVASATDRLAKAHAVVLGAVLVDKARESTDELVAKIDDDEVGDADEIGETDDLGGEDDETAAMEVTQLSAADR
jgi:polysaccharide biosynthesis transport protein